MTLNKETKLMLDAISALGNVLEIVDREGNYLYCSENSNFGNKSPQEMVGRNVKEIYNLTDDSSKVMQVIHTGIPLRDFLMSFFSYPTGKNYLWLYSAYPLIYNGVCAGAITMYKPFSNVKDVVQNVSTVSKKEMVSEPLEPKGLFQFKDIVYASVAMNEAIELGEKVAKSSASVLIIGETGTGKQLFAESIHSHGLKNKPFVAVNCAAIPDTLLESTLFGVVKGAYTGAVEKKGLFEQSSGGTIFLDEIQTLSTEMQAKLLRVLEYKVVRRVGGEKEISVNPRIVTAMNVPPEEYIKAGKMMPDLFFRIAVVTIRIPPLRERLSDIPLLVNKFIRHANKHMGTNLEGCKDEVLEHFSHYHWPGNVRELQHCIDHGAVVMNESESCLDMGDLPFSIRNAFLTSSFFNGELSTQLAEEIVLEENLEKRLEETQEEKQEDAILEIPSFTEKQDFFGVSVEDMEEELCELDYKTARQRAVDVFYQQFHQVYLKQALKKQGYNISRTAKELQITRQHLHKLMKQFQLDKD